MGLYSFFFIYLTYDTHDDTTPPGTKRKDVETCKQNPDDEGRAGERAEMRQTLGWCLQTSRGDGRSVRVCVASIDQ